MSNNINRTIRSGSAHIEVELDDPKLPDVKLKLSGPYYRAHHLRNAAAELAKLADDLDALEEEEDLTKFRASRYHASMAVKFDADGDVHLDVQDQVFHPSGVSELIDHLKKVRDRLSGE